jgi:hypothetical protein
MVEVRVNAFQAIQNNIFNYLFLYDFWVFYVVVKLLTGNARMRGGPANFPLRCSTIALGARPRIELGTYLAEGRRAN